MKLERFFFFFSLSCFRWSCPTSGTSGLWEGQLPNFYKVLQGTFFSRFPQTAVVTHRQLLPVFFFLWAENGQRRERRSGDAFTVFLWPLPDCTYCCQAGWKGKGPTAERGCRPNQPPTQDWYWWTVIHQVYTFDKSWPLSGFKETQIRRQKWQMRSNWPCETWSWQMVLGHH